MKSLPESRLQPDHEIQFHTIQLSDAASGAQAESLLAAEKRTLEMMANGANLSEVLNDLCAALDAHASPLPQRFV